MKNKLPLRDAGTICGLWWLPGLLLWICLCDGEAVAQTYLAFWEFARDATCKWCAGRRENVPGTFSSAWHVEFAQPALSPSPFCGQCMTSS